jgi:AraC-like DNA-binding protein
VAQGDLCGEIGSGDGFALGSNRAHEGECLTESDSWIVKISSDATKPLQTKSAVNRAAIFLANAPITRLLHTVLEAHYRLGNIEHPEAEIRLGLYLADLIALAMGPSPDGAYLATQRGLKAAQLQTVLDDIGRNFLLAGFSAADVAARLGISVRYVHLLLEETESSFSEHVLETRLIHAYEVLLSPARLPTLIVDIAFESGFSDLSHFNRSFRRRFGCTPRDVRAKGKMNGGS